MEREPTLTNLIEPVIRLSENCIMNDTQPYIDLYEALEDQYPHELAKFVEYIDTYEILVKAMVVFTSVTGRYGKTYILEDNRVETSGYEEIVVEGYLEKMKADPGYKWHAEFPGTWDPEDDSHWEWLDSRRDYIALGLTRLGYNNLYNVSRKPPMAGM